MSELYHYGVLGMKWGVRRYQNENGKLTPDGKERYNKEYSKATKHLEKLYSKAEKGAKKATESAKAKAFRFEKKEAKYRLKSAKIERKATRLIFPMNTRKAMRKIGAYDFKAARYEKRASNINLKIAKGSAAYEKYSKKGRSFYSSMVSTFASVPKSTFDKSDILKVKEIVNKYGL